MIAPRTTTPAIFSNAPSSFSGAPEGAGFCKSVIVLQIDEKSYEVNAVSTLTGRTALPATVKIQKRITVR